MNLKVWPIVRLRVLHIAVAVPDGLWVKRPRQLEADCEFLESLAGLLIDVDDDVLIVDFLRRIHLAPPIVPYVSKNNNSTGSLADF